MSIVYIYRLVDPRDWSIKYVGQTVNPEYRLMQHNKARHADPDGRDSKYAWIAGLFKDCCNIR